MNAIVRPFLRTLNAVGGPGAVTSGTATGPAWAASDGFDAASTAKIEYR